MNTFTRISTMILAITLVGCSSKPYIPPMFIVADTSPKPLDPTKSLALNLMEQGFKKIPYEIEDVDAPDEYGVQNEVFLGSTAAYGALALNLTAGWMMLPGALTPNPMKKEILRFTYIPADDIDISDTAAIKKRLYEQYTKPTIEHYISNEAQDAPFPTHIIQTTPYTMVQGSACLINYIGMSERYNNKKCSYNFNAYPVRYASRETMVIKDPQNLAKRYILVTSSMRTNAMHLVHNEQSNMSLYLIPAKSDIANFSNIKNIYPNMSAGVPRIVRVNNGQIENYFFLKP